MQFTMAPAGILEPRRRHPDSALVFRWHRGKTTSGIDCLRPRRKRLSCMREARIPGAYLESSQFSILEQVGFQTRLTNRKWRADRRVECNRESPVKNAARFFDLQIRAHSFARKCCVFFFAHAGLRYSKHIFRYL